VRLEEEGVGDIASKSMRSRRTLLEGNLSESSSAHNYRA